jgi:2-oxoisovalerate dehydrogenase E2 component (dihydrolipoyl transacylase)
LGPPDFRVPGDLGGPGATVTTVHVIRMPDLGEGIAEVELVAWHVAPGDAVAEDQVLADVMTDKATVEIPSPVAGVVVALGGEVGQLLAVGAELIRIELDAVDAAPPQQASPGPSRGVAAPAVAVAVAAQPDPPASASPEDIPVPALTSSSESSESSRSASSPEARRATPRPIASPAVRARAWELAIDLAQVVAKGSAGRIMQADLDAHLAQHAPAGTPAAARAGSPDSPTGKTQAVKIVGLRRKIAQKMQESKRRIPHFTYVEEVDMGELEALRAQLNEKWGGQRGHLTLLAFLIRATVRAVHEFPQINARLDDDAGVLTLHEAVHVGIATQTDAGLMVPVLRDAQARDLWANAAELRRLADAARSGKVVRNELSGSTLTITSLGRLGGIMSTPVINHPEVAIIGVNRLALRPVIRDGLVVVRQMMNLSSSFDHRVVDGAYAAAFVQCLRETLERPALLFID